MLMWNLAQADSPTKLALPECQCELHYQLFHSEKLSMSLPLFLTFRCAMHPRMLPSFRRCIIVRCHAKKKTFEIYLSADINWSCKRSANKFNCRCVPLKAFVELVSRPKSGRNVMIGLFAIVQQATAASRDFHIWTWHWNAPTLKCA